jgi:hypothetical protein
LFYIFDDFYTDVKPWIKKESRKKIKYSFLIDSISFHFYNIFYMKGQGVPPQMPF